MKEFSIVRWLMVALATLSACVSASAESLAEAWHMGLASLQTAAGKL